MSVQGLTHLTLSSIAEMDGGRIGEAMRQALVAVAQDLDDRPGDLRPREIALKIVAVPVCDESGCIDGAKIQMHVNTKTPTRKSKVYDVGVRKGGMFVFQDMSLDNHKQETLPFSGDNDND